MKNETRKAFRSLIILLLVTAMALSITACGGKDDKDDGAEAPKEETVTVGEYTFKPEKWVHNADEDTDSTQKYGLCLLMLGERVPVTMGVDGGNAQAAVQVSFTSGDTVTNANMVSYEHISDQGEYKIRATFFADLPKDQPLPDTATISLDTGDKPLSTVDISGLPEE